MRVLFHIPLSPYCRKVRVALKEKGLPFELKLENVWERREEFLRLNPAGKVPVLVEADGTAIPDSTAITEYLQEVQPQPDLLGASPAQRAETRRLVAWFDGKLHHEATVNLVGEKVLKRFLGHGEPNSATVRAGLANIKRPPGLHRLPGRAARLARRREVRPGRHRRRGPALLHRLYRRRALDPQRAGARVVRPGQVAPLLPPDPGGPGARPAPAAHYDDLDF